VDVRRRRLVAASVTLVAACAAVSAAAWLSSPDPVALARRVEARLQGTAGRAVPFTQMPPILREAVVATEDERFYRHHGIDVIGVIRALPYDITHLSFAQGASTITEQLAKLLYLGGNDHNPWRKLEDAAVAVKLENRYSKATILAAYLNTAYFGQQAYGVQAAAERYFGIPARALDPAQATLLAGLIQAPSLYDPLRDPRLARARQTEVVRGLVRSKYVSTAAGAAMLARPLPLENGTRLAPVVGVDLAPGPAFVWLLLAGGALLTLVGAASLVVFRGRRTGGAWAHRATTVVRVLVMLAGLGAIIRSFRTA
jgi:membrane peptidoglycan carboxypeptidase